VKLIVCDMPLKVKGACGRAHNEQESLILLNKKCNKRIRRATFKHELSHINNNEVGRAGIDVERAEILRHMRRKGGKNEE
jgi:hypothetical protein